MFCMSLLIFAEHKEIKFSKGLCISRPPGPVHRPGLQFVFAGPGLQFVIAGTGPQFVFTSPGPQLVFTDPDRNFAFTGPGS